MSEEKKDLEQEEMEVNEINDIQNTFFVVIFLSSWTWPDVSQKIPLSSFYVT